MNFLKHFEETIVYYWTNDFIEQRILLNKRFQWENKWNRSKMNNDFENEQNGMFT